MVDMSYFCFDHDISLKERCDEALRQWHLVEMDNIAIEKCEGGANPGYLRWMQAMLERGSSSSSKRPRTYDSMVKDNTKQLRDAIDQAEAENDMIRDDLRRAQARIYQLEHAIVIRDEAECERLEAQLRHVTAERDHLISTLQAVKELTARLPYGDFSSLQMGLQTARAYLLDLANLVF